MDSDTESESQAYVGGWDATEFAHIATTQALFSSQNESQDAEPSGADVEQAVRDLQSLDLEVVEKDEALHGVIQVASTTILSYLEHVVNALPPEGRGADMQDIQTVTSALLHPEFVALLFAYRQVFHAIAARSICTSTVSSAVVCWVDVIFAKIAVAITAISPDIPSSASQSEQLHGSMQKQLDCHLLRAATQLPSTWAALPTVLSAGHASPVACRLALHLLYGMYVLRPRLLGHESPQMTSPDRDRLFAALRSYLGRTQITPQSVVDYPDLISSQERIACAMFLSLFAAMDIQATGQGQPPFRPSTEAALLRYIMAVLCPTMELSDEELMTSSALLDTAQVIFLWHPQTIAWCWKVWGDQRVVHAEIIDYVTVTWLHHVGCHPAYGDPSSWDDEDVLIAIRMDTAVACSALLRLINRSLRLMTDQRLPLPTLGAVYRAVHFCSSHLLTDDALCGSNLIEELCSTLQRLFVHLNLDDTAAVTKDTILEGLSWVGVETLRTATENAFGHASAYKVKLEHNVAALTRLIVHAESNSLESADITNLRQLLQFFMLVWKSGAQLDDAFGQMMVPLLRDLVDRLSCDIASCHDDLTHLRSSCVLILSISRALGTDLLGALISADNIWEMVLVETGRPIDLVLASAFATYACAKQNNAEPLLYAFGWDYLRDALLLILNDHFLDTESPLAILVAPSICLALVALLVSADERIASYVLSSPWTMNLCATLQDILRPADDQEEDIYYQHLRERVTVPAAALLKEIKRALSTKGSNLMELPALADLHRKIRDS